MNISTMLCTAILALALGACANGEDDASNDAAEVDSAGVSTDASASVDSAASQTVMYDSRGKVTKIDKERARVELDHEKIDGWMDAMVMPFPVADPSLLDQVEIGKTYLFSVEVRGDDYKITKFTPAP